MCFDDGLKCVGGKSVVLLCSRERQRYVVCWRVAQVCCKRWCRCGENARYIIEGLLRVSGVRGSEGVLLGLSH